MLSIILRPTPDRNIESDHTTSSLWTYETLALLGYTGDWFTIHEIQTGKKEETL
jgi:hypothetical protein